MQKKKEFQKNKDNCFNLKNSSIQNKINKIFQQYSRLFSVPKNRIEKDLYNDKNKESLFYIDNLRINIEYTKNNLNNLKNRFKEMQNLIKQKKYLSLYKKTISNFINAEDIQSIFNILDGYKEDIKTPNKSWKTTYNEIKIYKEKEKTLENNLNELLNIIKELEIR